MGMYGKYICRECDVFFTSYTPEEYCKLHRKPRSKPRHEKRRAVLKDWGLLDKGGDGLRLRLVGQVFGHDSFDQGRYIETSPLLRLDIPAREAETLNTVYLLG